MAMLCAVVCIHLFCILIHIIIIGRIKLDLFCNLIWMQKTSSMGNPPQTQLFFCAKLHLLNKHRSQYQQIWHTHTRHNFSAHCSAAVRGVCPLQRLTRLTPPDSRGRRLFSQPGQLSQARAPTRGTLHTCEGAEKQGDKEASIYKVTVSFSCKLLCDSCELKVIIYCLAGNIGPDIIGYWKVKILPRNWIQFWQVKVFILEIKANFEGK